MTLIDPEADVLRGVAALDAVDPDWVYEISLDSLDVSDHTECVAGQQPGGFVATLIRLGLASNDDTRISGYRIQWDAARAHGFVAGSSIEYAQQERVWRRIITERRAADAAK